jgi:hypothetical protein
MPEMVIIDCVAIDHADAREHYWVTALCAGGYDLLNTQLGWKKRRAVAKYNPARNAKISAALTGRKLSAEHIENIRLSRVTVQLPPPEPDRGMKISLAKKGKRFSDAHRAAISAAKKGKPWSALQRAGAQRAAAQRAAAKA